MVHHVRIEITTIEELKNINYKLIKKMKIKRITLLTIFSLSILLLSGCGEMTYEEINNPEFIKGIVASGSWDVTVYQSNTPKAHIDYKDSYDITAEVRSDGYLHLKVKPHILRPNLKKNFKATVEIPSIEYIKGSDAANFSFNGNFEGDHCKIDLSDASDVRHFNYHGNTLEINLKDASDCSINGKGNHVKIYGSDASNVKMFNFTTETLDITLKDASDAEITVNERITGKLSDVSGLKYRGNADVSGVKTNDASKIKKTS